MGLVGRAALGLKLAGLLLLLKKASVNDMKIGGLVSIVLDVNLRVLPVDDPRLFVLFLIVEARRVA